ncbi:hypothetical protein Poli38472_006282 [Pythium oligandrum]|uniref:Uncharacterized protein n=1 Tax=Pythium oligandrum TaxID=41045 RepID=A0A8K1CSM0_PYTOL|nr:hypothetical protein Poli38472_006282 [Pythium oligandrum]|eukprot:TMW68814.1 hypothetical protein Poli38472_006282 [Pythium oligandrum]
MPRSATKDAEDEELRWRCAREVASLREQLVESDEEKELLRERIMVLTKHLTDTTEELEQRMALFAEATSQIEQLESQVSDAKKAVLSREMQIHELKQKSLGLEKVMETKDKEREHWEREYIAAKDEVARMTRVTQRMQCDHDEKTGEIATWKAKLHKMVKAFEELKRNQEEMRRRELVLVDEITRSKASLMENEKKWKLRLAKRERMIATLEKEVEALRKLKADNEDEKKKRVDEEAALRTNEATSQLEKRRQLLTLRADLNRAKDDLQKSKLAEMLLQREVRRLREELLLSESQRKTDHRRSEQLIQGKEKEMAFVWQKYVEAKCPQPVNKPKDYR